MKTEALISNAADLAHCVEAFEDALAQNSDIDLARFLPEPMHALYPQVLAELVRVDMEHAWSNHQPRRLDDYLRFPTVFKNRSVLEVVAFEEFRLRRQAGEYVTPEQYHSLYQIDTADWPSMSSAASESDLYRTNVVSELQPATNRIEVAPLETDHQNEHSVRWTAASRVLPEPGTDFLGFHLIEELGRGAFGRVYLAHQGDLAARPVALKVACDIAAESQKLAQLQHTNIVPIYSFHGTGSLQAACMPYFGRTTLAQVLEKVSGEAGLPSSGRELRSTLNRRPLETVRSRSSVDSNEEASSPVVPAKAETVPGAADCWTRLEGLSYVEAVLWLGGQVAEGLAHAHDRGIVHRDLKPANVLLTDDGRPMLLDFNLAEDTKTRGGAERASVGGTLPYMAPEHLEAFGGTGPRTLDGRCDIFSLGVILFELLTGRHPYPTHKKKVREAIPAMLIDRRREPPRLRDRNPGISPATEAIIRKCLEGDREKRYQKAEHLREDLDRQLNNLPLKYASNPSRRERLWKWVRRHPRVTSSGTVAAAASVLLLAIGAGAVYSRERAHNLHAHAQLTEHQAAFDNAQLFVDDRNQSYTRLEDAIAGLRGVLERYGVSETGGDEWMQSDAVTRLTPEERDRVRGDIGETFYLLAELASHQARAKEPHTAERMAHLEQAELWHGNAERLAADRIPSALKSQREWLEDLLKGRIGEQRAEVIEASRIDLPRDLFLLGTRLTQSGEHLKSLPFLQKATQLEPRNFSAWFVRGTMHLALSQHELAAACFTACTALREDFAPGWLNRARAFNGMRFFELASADYDRAIRLDPKLAEAYIQRAAARDALYDPKGAEQDFTRALETGAAPIRVYFLRADVRRRLGDVKGSDADLKEGLRVKPKDELSWIGRAEMRLETNPTDALEDVEEALKINPFSMFALQLKAHILSERLKRPADSVAVLDRAVKFHPDHAPLRAGRGVLLARAGQRDAARRDARDALRRDSLPPNQYQVACIYALVGDKAEALALLWASLKTGYGMDFVDGDTDLDGLRKDRGFLEMLAEAKALEASRKK